MNPPLPSIVCEACAVIALHKGNVLHVLPQLFTVYIPEFVKQECNDDKYESIDLSSFIYLPVENVLAVGLGQGAREVISLAVEQNTSTLITDDKKAFNKAKTFGIIPIVVTDILLLAKNKGYLESVKTVLDTMSQNGEGIEDEKYNTILQRAGEMQ